MSFAGILVHNTVYDGCTMSRCRSSYLRIKRATGIPDRFCMCTWRSFDYDEQKLQETRGYYLSCTIEA